MLLPESKIRTALQALAGPSTVANRVSASSRTLRQFPLSFPKREFGEAAFFMTGAAKGMLYYNTARLLSVLRKEAYV